MFLSDAVIGKKVKIKSFINLDKAEIIKLNNSGIKEGVSVELLYIHPYNKNLLVYVEGYQIALGKCIAKGIEIYE